MAERDGLTWVFNFTDDTLSIETDSAEWVIGGPAVGAYDLGVVRAPAASLAVDLGR